MTISSQQLIDNIIIEREDSRKDKGKRKAQKQKQKEELETYVKKTSITYKWIKENGLAKEEDYPFI